MKILITGSDGFIGKNLYNSLKDQPNTQITLLDKNTGHNIKDCELPLVDVVIHLAGKSGVRDSLNYPTEYWANNVIYSKRIFDFYSNYHKARILYASSSTAKEPWRNPYAMSKYGMELIAPDNSLGMRFTTVYGPGARENMLIPKILKGDVSYINCDHHRDFIHVYDIIHAIKLLMHVDDTGVTDIGTGYLHFLPDLTSAFGIEPKKVLGGDTERKENKADISLLTKYDWKPAVNLYDYIKMQRAVN